MHLLCPFVKRFAPRARLGRALIQQHQLCCEHCLSPRTQQNLDQVFPGVELAHEHAFECRGKLGDAYGDRALSVIDDVVSVDWQRLSQTSSHDFSEI